MGTGFGRLPCRAISRRPIAVCHVPFARFANGALFVAELDYGPSFAGSKHFLRRWALRTASLARAKKRNSYNQAARGLDREDLRWMQAGLPNPP